MFDKLKRVWSNIKPGLCDLELPVLVFPVFVVLIVAITFLFPSGRCGAWQWWSAAALTLAVIFARKDSFARSMICAALLLVFFLAVWVITKVTITTGWFDISRYHLPAIRMMIEGWNPVWQGTFDGIEQATGMSPDWMNPYHVISMQKGVWYFCASSYYFTHAAFNLMQPMMIFIFVSMLYSLFRAFGAQNIFFKLLATLVVFIYMPTHDDIVDGVVACSALGLVLEMYRYLKVGKWSVLRLIVFTFWMAVSKQTSMLHAVVFWGVFFVFNLFRKNWKIWREISVVGIASSILVLAVCVSPYVSSYMNFGHPLYPRFTGDEEKYPAVNITDDFLDRNEDAAGMGHIGAWVNGFVSAKGAQAYYKYKYSKDEFSPEVLAWYNRGKPDGSPTDNWYRARFTGAILALLILGGLPGVFLAVSFILATMAAPTEMLGYVRYTPWAACTIALALLAAEKIRWKILQWIIFAAFAYYAMDEACDTTFFKIAESIDNSYSIKKILKEAPPRMLIADCTGRYNEKEDPLVANLLLTIKQVPELEQSKVVYNPYNELGENIKEQGHIFFYDENCKVTRDCDLDKYSGLRRFKKRKDETRKAKAKFIIKTFSTTMPKSLWETIHGK